MKDYRPRLTKTEYELIKSHREDNTSNVLVIGDLHLPFCLDGYLEFCIEQRDKYKCDKIIFIGDIIDNHYSSYHEDSTEGYGGGEELEHAISELKPWYKAFPDATVIIGNHDRLIMRKAQTSKIPVKWIKSYKDVLEVPKWAFVESVEIDNVLYIHGEGGTARARMKKDLQSVVQGHLHTQAYTEHLVGSNFNIFGMQVGCGINHKTYAMAYAKNYGKPAIGCGIVLDNGTLPFNKLMEL